MLSFSKRYAVIDDLPYIASHSYRLPLIACHLIDIEYVARRKTATSP